MPQITEIRHQIHEHPELGNREEETAALVADYLRMLGFDDVRTGVAHTGVVAVLRGGRPGPVVAVRADMDALPVTEETDLPFRSTRRTMYLGQEVGVMHACGHDVHTAVQLGVAAILKALQTDLPGTVMFLFQPAEEGPPPGEEGGAALMLAEGVFSDLRPEAVFGLHARAHLDVGRAAYTPGGALAAVDHFRVTIRGRQSHGAAPHLGIDPVVLAAQAVTALQTIRSRTLSPLAPSVVTVGMIHGGTRFNIIPGEVALEGTVRTYDPAVQDTVERRMAGDPGRRHPGGRRLVRARLRPDCPGDHQRPGFDRALGSQPGRRPRRRPSRGGRPLDGRRGLLALRQRGAGVLLHAGHPGARHDVGRSPFADVPRRRRRATGRNADDGLHRLGLSQRPDRTMNTEPVGKAMVQNTTRWPCRSSMLPVSAGCDASGSDGNATIRACAWSTTVVPTRWPHGIPSA